MNDRDWQTIQALEKERLELLDTVQRLREALHRVSNASVYAAPHDVREIARAALSEEPREYRMTSDGWQPDPDQPGFSEEPR